MNAAKLVRTKGGRMVHRDGCSYAHWGVPWAWAEGKDTVLVLAAAQDLGIGFCKRCKPLSEEAGS